MRKLAIAAALAGSLGLAAPALAGPGQCYDAYGRPVGPVYDTDHPNYGFINAVIRRGGSCTGVRSDYDPYPSYRRRHYGHDYDYSPRYYKRSPRYYYEGGRRYRRQPPASDTPRNRRDGYRNVHPNTPPPQKLTPGEQSQQGRPGSNYQPPGN